MTKVFTEFGKEKYCFCWFTKLWQSPWRMQSCSGIQFKRVFGKIYIYGCNPTNHRVDALFYAVGARYINQTREVEGEK